MLRCPDCRTRRTTWSAMQRHIVRTNHAHCQCAGYHFKHRPGSPCCDSHPDAAIHRAIREGDTEAWILLPGKPGGAEAPF